MSGDLAVELRRLEQEGSTGVLLAGDGEFHLAYGAIASAHCHRATGLDRLVVEAGVATPEDWQRAGAGDPSRVLEQPQLETLALLSVYDAAYFLLSSGAAPEFRPAPAHWLARVCHVRPRELVRECERRGDPGSGPWPAELVDRAPVVPVRRVHRRRVVLTAGQAEVLAAADTRRSVTDIARYLGRTTYGCLTAVRELTVAGLIEPAALEPDSPHVALTESADGGSRSSGLRLPALPERTPSTDHVEPPRPERAESRGCAELLSRSGRAPMTGRAEPMPPPERVPVPARQERANITLLPPVTRPVRGAPIAPPPGPVAPPARSVAPVNRAAPAPNPAPNPAPPEPLRQRIRRAVPAAERERWEQVDMSVLVRVRAALEELE